MAKRQKRCSRCKEPIDFVLRSGFIPKGQGRYFIVNADDRRPHGPRCKLKQALAEAKSAGPAQLRRLKQKQNAPEPPAAEGVQIDAFSDCQASRPPGR
jgi:hypothetical protein